MTPPLQGTARSFDPVTRCGVVLLDDGRPLSFSAAAFQASGLRLLRPGQRVCLLLVDGEVSRLAIGPL